MMFSSNYHSAAKFDWELLYPLGILFKFLWFWSVWHKFFVIKKVIFQLFYRQWMLVRRLFKECWLIGMDSERERERERETETERQRDREREWREIHAVSMPWWWWWMMIIKSIIRIFSWFGFDFFV